MTDRDDLIRQAREMLRGLPDESWAVSGMRRKIGGYPILTVFSEKDDNGIVAVFYSDKTPALHREAHGIARFIAWCREGVPALIAELEERNG